MTLAGLKRKLTKPKLLKELVTTDVLTRLVESLGKAPSLSDIRLAASLLLAFLSLMTCPVAMLERYISAAGISLSSKLISSGAF